MPIKKLTIENVSALIRDFRVGIDEPGDLYLTDIDTYNGMYKLSAGAYLVEFEEGVRVGHYGEIYPTEDLFYCGASIHGGIYRSGDTVQAVLRAPTTVRIAEDASIAKMEVRPVNIETVIDKYFENEIRPKLKPYMGGGSTSDEGDEENNDS